MVVRDLDERPVRTFATRESAEAWTAENSRPDSTYASYFVKAVEVYP